MQFNNSSTCSADLATVGEDLPVDYADWLPKSHPSDRRRAGVLLHPTSFPGPYGIGDLGDQTFRFLDWLHELVPLVPPGRKANEEVSHTLDRLKLWLFLAYVVSFVSLAASVGLLIQNSIVKTGPSASTRTAGVLQCVFVFISGLIYWTSHSE